MAFTDDTVLTVATAFSLLTDGDYAENYRIFGRLYPMAGYGNMFMDWLASPAPKPYGSYGNGSAMRVAPVGWAFDTADEVLADPGLPAGYWPEEDPVPRWWPYCVKRLYDAS